MTPENIATTTTRAERIAVWGLLAAALVLHVFFAFRHNMDSDEPQHLHVVWGWAHGLLQYRDVFDNHMPLFQILMAPLARCLGDRPDLLILMRLAMIPITAGGIACVWSIGRSVFGSRVGVWAAALTALFPPLFLGDCEFRTDTLWTTCWLATIAVLCGLRRGGRVVGDAGVSPACAEGILPASSLFPAVSSSSSSSAKQQQLKQDAGKMPATHADKMSATREAKMASPHAGGTPASLTIRRGLLAGLALGATFSVSLKTTYLFLGLTGAGLLTLVLSAGFLSWKRTTLGAGRFLLAMLIGWLLLPGAIVAFFWLRGAGGDMYYGVIGHNMIHLDRSVSWPLTALLAVACVVPACAAGFKFLKSRTAESACLRGVFVILLGGTTTASLLLWPKITTQDYLPLYPIWMILVVAFIGMAWSSIREVVRSGWAGRVMFRATAPLVFAILAVAELLVIAWVPDGDGRPGQYLPLWRDVLRLTDSGQVVMDLKGELIFRPRAYRYVVETLTSLMLQRGILPAEDIRKSMIDRNACVASNSFHRLPRQTKEFIEGNYLPVGTLLAVGKTLVDKTHKTDESGNVDFDVVIETRYAILAPGGPARGQLDGRTYAGPVRLAPGRHRYKPAEGEGKLALIWAQAIERGYYPPGFARSPN